MQEIGRAGRDELPSCALLYYEESDMKHSTIEIIHYCLNSSVCRRDILFADFPEYIRRNNPIGCNCCDVCAMNCVCGYCIEKLSMFTNV